MPFIFIIAAVAASAIGIALYERKTKQANSEISNSESESSNANISNAYSSDMSNFDKKVSDLATAISQAEGFGVAGAIPTRYHNPGDLKPPNGSASYWSGQSGVGDGGHAIFKTDNDGWNALYKQVRLWATNKSSVVGTGNTFLQLAQKYAEDWQPWINNVIRGLQSMGYTVTQNSTLGEYFNG